MPPRTHTKAIMYDLKILANIQALYVARVCAEIHPFIHQKKALNRSDHIHDYRRAGDVHRYNTRNSQSGALHRSKKNAHLTNEYTRIWNTIPDSIRNITNSDKFNRTLKFFLQEEQYADRL